MTAGRGRRTGRLGYLVVVVLLAAIFGVGRLYDSPRGETGGWMAGQRLEPRFATVNGRNVRYVRAGSGEGPAVVLVHGFASSLYTWKDVLPALAPGHDVIALDLPGFGGSDAPADLSFTEYVPVVMGLLDQLGVDKAVLVGNSMGGAVAIAAAADHPERVRGLVLIDASAYRMGDPSQRPWPIRVAGNPAISAVLDQLPIRRLLVRAALRQVFHDDELVTPDRLDEYAVPVQRPGVPAAVRSLLASRSIEPDFVERRLPQVKAPTLILWGREDAWLPVADADRLATAWPRSRKVVLDSCGHMPQEERPADVIAALLAFLAELPER